jgi:hypothetical protein
LRLSWASQSDTDAAELKKLAVSEMTKILRVNVTGGRGRLQKTSSGADVTKELSPKWGISLQAKRTSESMAKETGLSELYDVSYRFGSLAPHAAMLGLDSESEKRRPCWFPWWDTDDIGWPYYNSGRSLG